MLDWAKFRPLGEWLVVKGDPRVKKTKGGIVLTDQLTGVERVMEGSGTVLRVGPKVEKCLGRALEIGTRIVFRGFLKDATFQEFTPEDDCPVFLLHAKDVSLEIGPEDRVGAFS